MEELSWALKGNKFIIVRTAKRRLFKKPMKMRWKLLIAVHSVKKSRKFINPFSDRDGNGQLRFVELAFITWKVLER